MPLWRIYHPADAFSREDKRELAGRITELYKFLPKFYVNVLFREMDEDDFLIGGEPTKNFVRICIEHIARQLPNDEAKVWFIGQINETIAPYVKDRGRDWEFHILETPFDLWNVQGYAPPKPNTDDEKRWAAENRPSPRTHA